ncbi:hypothetical protein FIA58_017620, partial [Flavobacterium jejuense]|nr:hypothetical protein [Flavobacterium jejuense]
MKKILHFFIIITLLTFNQIYSQSPTCDTASGICSGQGGPYNNTNTTTPGGNAAGYGQVNCLFSTPYPAWFYMQVGTSGSMDFTLIQTTSGNSDVDFALWGPFNSLNNVCDNLSGFSPGYTGPVNLVDCSYSGSATENINITNGVHGEYYILLVTNFGQQPGTYTINQTGGTGSLSCDIVCGVDLGPDELYCSTTINNTTLTATFNQEPTLAGTPTYEWYLDGVLQTTTTTNTLNVTQNGTWEVRVVRPGCSDLAIDQIEVAFTSEPVLNTPVDLIGPNNDCSPVFDLTSVIPAMLSPASPSDFDVYFYLSLFGPGGSLAGNYASAIPNPTAFTPNPVGNTTIYVRVENDLNPTCAEFTEFQVIVNCGIVIVQPSDLYACDDISNDGFEIFDLTSQSATVLGTNNPSNY